MQIAESHTSELPELRIHLFGPMEVQVAGGVAARLPSRRAMWLLAYLALRKGRPIERQSLAGLLWPDSADAGALHNLRQTLAGLRRAMGPAGDFIKNVSPRAIFLQTTPAVWVDVVEFDAASADGSLSALERAVELYRGPLLEECQEPFALAEREARERSFLAVAELLAAHYASGQDHGRATEILRRAIASDPYRESSFRALMTSLAESGEAAAALELYRGLRHRLRRDLSSDPDPETLALYRSIRGKMAAPTSAAPVRAGREQRIPVPLSALLGREPEVREVASLMERCRLVTLTGVAGVGKTRLAIAVAHAIGDNFTDGARFVDLAPLEDSASVPWALVASLDVHEQAGRPLLDTLADRLRGCDLFIVLDNCEHLAPGVAGALEMLLSACPGLHVLATSRQSIGVKGELVWRVPSLSIPEPASSAAWRSKGFTDRGQYLMHSDSVRLFLDRCSQVGAPAAPTDLDLEAIGSICRRLDGIPLALELAASRTKVLSATEIESRLEDRFTLLASGNNSLARHQTMRAAIAWSWGLLSEGERRLMMSLCVFRGGCTLEAIEAVFPGAEGDGPVLDLLASLVDRSLIIAARNAEGTRFSMLESIRQFATDRLRETNDWELAFDRHLNFFIAWAETAKGKQHGSEQKVWFRRMEVDHDNLRAALDWCYSRRDGVKGLYLAALLGRFWDTHGHLSEGRARLEAMLKWAEASAPPQLVASARVQVGWVATVQRDCEAARDHFEKAMAYSRSVGDEASIAAMFNLLACASAYAGDYATAMAQYELSLEISRRLDMTGFGAMILNNLAEIALMQADSGAARTYLEQSIAMGGQPDTLSPERGGLILGNLSLTDFRQGRSESARAAALRALQLFRDAEVVVSIPGVLNLVAIVLTRCEDWDRVARLLGAAESLSAVQGVPLPELMQVDRKEALASARTALGPEGFDSAFAAGQQMTMEESVAYALSGGGSVVHGDPASEP